MRMKFYTLVAGGVRDIECYDYGPWYAGIDSWGRRFDLYGAIRDCNFEMGKIDPYLEGTTRRPTDVAILYNRTASIWAQDNNACTTNASFTHWALAHAGYDADFLAEEDIESGSLAGYKVVYADGPQVRRQTARAMADWVKQGGVLCASAGAGSRDEFDRPMDILEPCFGARSRSLEVKASPGRPKYELRSLKALDRVVPSGTFAKEVAPLDQLCLAESLEPLAGAEVILKNREGRPGGTIHKTGRGTAIRLAALPGVSYVHEAVQPPYDPDSYLPRQFRPELCRMIAWPACLAGATRMAATDSQPAEIVRYDGPDRAVVFVIDHRGERTASFSFELFQAGGFTRAIAATGSRVELIQTGGGRLKVSLPMNACDAIVLLK
jgi:hypothetical protein